jgi:hypothetical protein
MTRFIAACLTPVLLFAAPGAGQVPPATCQLELTLVDAVTGQPLPGIVQVLDGTGKAIDIPELVNRGQGIEQQGPIHQWWVLPKATTVTVPQAPLTIKALAGLETELATQPLDLTKNVRAKAAIRLNRFYEARRGGRLAGNTHLHLMKLSKSQADRYLREVPLGDGLDIVFVSYLERAKADSEYTSNNYSRKDLERMSHGHVHYGHGQEHRHNFGTHGEGYGHILLLDIPYIIRPVSIGPGIMGSGSDAPPLQVGIDEARRTGGRVIWAHNLYGFEDIPNWITGRVHANNIYDGSHRGSYEDTYYRYLNIGLFVPFSTGTDWFIYDFSRVYVLADQRPITAKGWLDLLAAGKSFITNGPLLDLTVDSKPVGSKLDLAQPGSVKVSGRAVGRLDFKQIELIHNGRAVQTSPSRRDNGHFVADIELALPIDAPSWVALRTPPPPAPEDTGSQRQVVENELGGKLFSHTSPIYVQLAGQGVFDTKVAEGLIAEMRAAVEKIKAAAQFADPSQRKQVLGVYDEAIRVLEKQIERHGARQARREE